MFQINRKENNNITYRAAHAVAETVENHFTRLFTEASKQNNFKLAPQPESWVIESMIDAAFWASLRREEGHSPKISLAFTPPESVKRPTLFSQHLQLKPFVLTKISPGVERAGIHLGVWHNEDGLYIWGTTCNIPDLCFVVDVSEPGLLVVKNRRLKGFGKYNNIAILVGDQVKIIDETSKNLPDCPQLLTSLLGFTLPDYSDDKIKVLVQLAVSMRAHKRGGTLLVVPPDSDNWQNSISQPVSFSIKPNESGLAALLKQDKAKRKSLNWIEKLRMEVENIAGLTAIDGATIINENYQLIAFGATIGRPFDSLPVEKIVLTEPVVGIAPQTLHPSDIGGTRHISAAQFVNDQHDALALVASQDGRFTIFAWSPCENMVHAHRIESLLL